MYNRQRKVSLFCFQWVVHCFLFSIYSIYAKEISERFLSKCLVEHTKLIEKRCWGSLLFLYYFWLLRLYWEQVSPTGVMYMKKIQFFRIRSVPNRRFQIKYMPIKNPNWVVNCIIKKLVENDKIFLKTGPFILSYRIIFKTAESII